MTNAEIHVKAHRCINTLRSRFKLVAQEHRERIKQLHHLAQTIEREGAAGQLDLRSDQRVSLSPKIERLLGDPTHGL